MKPKDMKKWAKKEDIARAVVFLASDESAGVTGQTLAVTGWGI
jgi:NAD(P)-dependent dehydrogenase (short-subunit alcohol dehydrogenase family)